MKGSDEEEYGSCYYTTSASSNNRIIGGGGGQSSSASSSSGSSRLYPTRYREYSPNRGQGNPSAHHHQPHSSSSSTLVDGNGSPYSIPPSVNTRSYSRTPTYTSSRNSIVEYAPPCCHQYYHQVPPHQIQISPHPSNSPTHFNTIPHPPLQYRDVPSCATMNRSYNTRRQQQSNPYTSYYPNGNSSIENPYSDPRTDIYYTSTLSRSSHNPRTNRYGTGLGQLDQRNSQLVHESTKLYDPPPPPIGYGSATPSTVVQSTSHPHPLLQHQHEPSRTYLVPPTNQSSILRLDEPRIYSSSALQLGPSGIGAQGNNNLTSNRSNSPQHRQHHPHTHQQHPHYIDRSISLIRLDNSGLVLPNGPTSNALARMDMSGQGTYNIPGTSSSAQGRIKFPPEILSGSQSQQVQSNCAVGGVGSGALMKTTVELNGSSDQLTPGKSKFKILMDSTMIPSSKTSTSNVVEMFDKAVMTSQLPEQWSLMSSSSSSAENNQRRGSETSPPGSHPPVALSGGIPDLLPTCVATASTRHSSEYPSNAPSW